MVDWSQYGLGEYAEGFEKLGIRSIDELKAMAPTLEDDYGLDGLCDLLGVERKKKVDPPPVSSSSSSPRTSSTSHASSSSSSSSTPGCLSSFLTKCLIVCIAALIIIPLIIAVGPKLGLLKNTLTVTLSASESEYLNLRNAKLVMVDHADEHKIRTKAFDKEKTATIKVPLGEYDTYVTCDGCSFYYGHYSSDGLTKNSITLELEKVFLRSAVLEFYDEKGNVLEPQNVRVMRAGSEEPESCSRFEESRYVLLLPNNTGKETLQIYADDYEMTTVEYDWSSDRFFRLEVVLKNA